MFTVRNRPWPPPMRIGFAGAGNMAAAMARGWAEGGEGEPAVESMTFVDAGSGRAGELADEVGGEAVSAPGELPERSDVIVLAVKPRALAEIADALGDDLPPLISVLAGVPVARLAEAFPDVPVLRAMPNVAVEVRRGVICYVAGGEQERMLTGLLGHLGVLVPLDEDAIDAATAVMSCSPAYIALVAEALADAGADAGLSAPLARDLVAESLAGAAELLRQRDPQSIRRAVASPGGATEAGLEALAERDVAAAVHEAVRASLERMGR